MSGLLKQLADNWLPILVGILVVLIVVERFDVKKHEAENARLTKSVATSQIVITRLTGDLKANQLALEQRQAETAQLSQERQDAVQSLEKIYETDKEACDWSAGVIPDSVYNQLCKK
jgi:Tfp pilus assembly protein PilN